MPLRRIPAARDELKPRCTGEDDDGERAALARPLSLSLSLPPTFAISNDDPIRAVPFYLFIFIGRSTPLCRYGGDKQILGENRVPPKFHYCGITPSNS